ncbi:MAG TPA: protoporphyrinogen oxidase, partial [Gaiellaceae bacterium]|nr:protoporphyrinogen oxidase [Gaiellaceae bacterium]
RLGVGLERIEATGAHYAARLSDGTRLDADAVVVATPAADAARAVADVAPAAADALGTIAYRGTAAISLGYDSRQLRRPPAGHGFLVPDGELPVAACTWSSAKWPDRAPDGAVLLRATIRSDALIARDADELVDVAHRALARVVGIEGTPVVARVAAWPSAMPRYTVGHLDRLARIGAALLPFPGIVLAGAAYRGAGVADCIAQGQMAAQTVLAREAVSA